MPFPASRVQSKVLSGNRAGPIPRIVYLCNVVWCVCIELCPSHATNAPPILRSTAFVEAHYLHLYPPLLASKAVLSSFSFQGGNTCSNYQEYVPGVTGISGIYQAGTTRTRHYIEGVHSIYVRVYVECTGTRFTCSVRTVCDVWRRSIYMHVFGVNDSLHLLITFYTST